MRPSKNRGLVMKISTTVPVTEMGDVAQFLARADNMLFDYINREKAEMRDLASR